MGSKNIKFLLYYQAIDEIKNTLLMQSEEKIRDEIMPILNRLANFEVKKDTIKVDPLDFYRRNGLWIKIHCSEKFYYGVDLVDYFTDLLISKPLNIIATVFSEIHWVKTIVSNDSITGKVGLLIETEMEKFKCVQCGHCCLDLSDAFQTSVPDSDVNRWRSENRYDILEWVDTFAGFNDIWISSKTSEPVNRCPWLRKLPNKDKYICRIHVTKPEHCRKFPKSKRHAIESGCKGFPAE